MKVHRFLKIALLSSVALAGCGGGGDDSAVQGPPTTKGSFSAVVSFGDSLSDVGTYAPATSLAGDGAAPYMGGRFTTNAVGSTIWVENLAVSLGLAVTPAEVGFDGRSIKCPAAAVDPALARTCTAYGQGGARVTARQGIGHNLDGSGALTVPVVSQIANHLARFGNFKGSDLVFVYAGNNDVFIAFAIYVAVVEITQAQAASGILTATEAAAQVAAARKGLEDQVATAATELAAAVKTQILANGGLYVAVMTLPDIADTPFGRELPAALQPVLTQFSVTFNDALRSGLAGAAAQIIDTYALSKEVYANPAKYGFTNNSVRACEIDRIYAITGSAIADGSSLFCNATAGAPYNGLAPGADSISWQFADDVHPTTGGHRAITQAFIGQLQSFGWI